VEVRPSEEEKYNRPDYTVQESKYFSPKRMWAAKLVGKSYERVTTLAARREIRKERDTRNSVVMGKGYPQMALVGR
jgi:hypothetical protein